jgi:hypothetical protein
MQGSRSRDSGRTTCDRGHPRSRRCWRTARRRANGGQRARHTGTARAGDRPAALTRPDRRRRQTPRSLPASAGVRPGRSNATYKVRRSAVAAGVRPLDASATLMNRSTGVWAQGSDKRSGGYDGFSGRNDQWSRWASVTITSERPDLAFAAVSGQVAPSDTQRLSTACSPAGRRSPSGGIRTWESSEAIRSKRALALESPGTIAGSPESPPTHAELRVSSRSPPRCLSGPWHLKHAREERAYLCGEIDRPEISAWLLVVRSRDTRQRESDSQRFGEC